MSTTETGGPAFPETKEQHTWFPDMTQRHYAAIHLKVPNSGTPWLDDMILESLRNDFAAKAMQTLLGSEYTSEHGLHEGWMTALAHESYMVADAMLAARKQPTESKP